MSTPRILSSTPMRVTIRSHSISRTQATSQKSCRSFYSTTFTPKTRFKNSRSYNLIHRQTQMVAHPISRQGYRFIWGGLSDGANVLASKYLVTVPSISDVAPAMAAAIKKEYTAAASGPFRALVFAPTREFAHFYGRVLDNFQGLPSVSCFHSHAKPRISKARRADISQKFGEASSIIYVVTDRWAQGMDFPGVTHVFQVGAPPGKKDYSRRWSYMEKAGAEARGILILSESEKPILSQVKDAKVQDFPHQLEYSVDDILSSTFSLDKRKLYQSLIGYYYQHQLAALKWSTDELVQQANTFALKGLGCAQVPAMRPSMVAAMEEKGVHGLKVL